MSANQYRILGIKKGAAASEVTARYRKLALEYHPDLSDAVDSAQRFSEITQAYQVVLAELKDSVKREPVKKAAVGKQTALSQGFSWCRQTGTEILLRVNGYLTGGKLDVLLHSRVAASELKKGIVNLDLEFVDYNASGRKVRTQKKLKISLPDNYQIGETIRLRGLGKTNYLTSRTGDLLVKISVD